MAIQNMITAAFVQQFHNSYEIAAQQTVSVLEATIFSRGTIVGSSFTVNDMGIVEMHDATKFADTVWTIPESGTRQAIMTDKTLAIPVWKQDLQKLIANPQGPYMQLCVAAGNREKDKTIYRALLDSVLRKEEENGAYTPVALPAAQKIAAGGTTFTKAKAIYARSIFRRNQVDGQQGEKLYIAYDAEMLRQILSDPTLTSADYMAGKMLQEGQVAGQWLGFNWVPYESLDRAANVTTTVAWTGTSTHFGIGSNLQTDIGPRRDKQGTMQIQVDCGYGAARANEKKVVQIDFEV